MALELQTPVTYLITNGQAKVQTWTVDCERILALIESAVEARMSLIQIREKNLSAHSLYELASRAAKLTRNSSTRLLVNDRADIAKTAGADGVHLTSHSLDTRVVRSCFGDQFLVGVSTHSLVDARTARDNGANFAVFGPVFETPTKSGYGPPKGVDALRTVARDLYPFPVIALGGITMANAALALASGASGVAAIRAFSSGSELEESMRVIRGWSVAK